MNSMRRCADAADRTLAPSSGRSIVRGRSGCRNVAKGRNDQAFIAQLRLVAELRHKRGRKALLR
jgi:hypothetical protein